MKAIGYKKSLPIDNEQSLIDLDLPKPIPGPKDLLVTVKAIALNPVDTKVRQRAEPAEGEVQVLGWDVAGVVSEVGVDVSMFKSGDEVWYAGAIDRPGANSEFHVVDERIVSKKPTSLSFSEAAALPLTSITAWELLFDRLEIPKDDASKSILIIGAAGGVGSIMVQLVKKLTKLKVIGTASRQETKTWIENLGVDHVLDHSKPLAEELEKAGLGEVNYVASLTQTDKHFENIVACLKPQGKLALIDDPESLPINLLKKKSISTHWEFMFTRSMFQTEDIIVQHELLNEVAKLVDEGTIQTTANESFGTISVENLKKGHALLESGKSKGKIVLEGF